MSDFTVSAPKNGPPIRPAAKDRQPLRAGCPGCKGGLGKTCGLVERYPRFREEMLGHVPDMRQVVPDGQLYRHPGRLGAGSDTGGIVEQDFRRANLDEQRRQAREIAIKR